VLERPNDDIFVAIAAYREPELRMTIDSCIETAARPERLQFGICLQSDRSGPPGTQPDCLEGHPAVIRMNSFDWTESKGGCWARHNAQGLYDGEGFTLQIDSHMRMADNWDQELITFMQELSCDKPLITGHAPLYDLDIDGDGVATVTYRSSGEHVPVTVVKEYAQAGWLHHPGEERPDITATPRPTRVMSGMFAFTLGEWNIEVRQDPEHLYTGEEFALTLRSFTHGYDLFSPRRVVAWHRNHPQGNAKFIYDGDDAEVQRRHDRAIQRLRVLQAGDPDRILEPYSTGPLRTVAEYGEWAGLGYATRSISDDARQGVTPELFQPGW